MTLLIDNYDSFSYNLYQYVGELDPDIRVIRNDEMTPAEIRVLRPDRILLSPGPGRPENAGTLLSVVRELGPDFPMLGVCLGHQAICAAFGGTVTYARTLMHGKQSTISLVRDCPLFAGCPETMQVARYHSLAAATDDLPSCLRITAVTQDDDREIMAVQHTAYAIYGVQFHPESILTPSGKTILKNFIRMKAANAAADHR